MKVNDLLLDASGDYMACANCNQEAFTSIQHSLILTCPDCELPGQHIKLFPIARVAMQRVCVPGGK